MPHDAPQPPWHEFLRRISARIVEDVDLVATRMDLPREVASELRGRIKESLHRELRQGDDLWMRDWAAWWRDQRQVMEGIAHDKRRLNDTLLEMESRLAERLAAIEERIDATNARPCLYGERDGLGGLGGLVGTGRTAGYVSLMKNVKTGRSEPDQASFTQKLRRVASDGRTLILVDPYALSESNDAGDKGDCVDKILEVVGGGSIEQLHVYARTDAATSKVWKKLEDALPKIKLTVHLGDLHDRYLLVGNDSEKGAWRFDDDWNGWPYWRGVVFGASLNGVTKRPTYVLNFEKSDIDAIKTYLDDHAPTTTLLNQRNAENDREKRAAAQRAKAAGIGKTHGKAS